jgi:hypothetical protein
VEVVCAGWLAPVLKFRQPSDELQCIKTACACYAVSVDQGVCVSIRPRSKRGVWPSV